jgi:hypothetical protein
MIPRNTRHNKPMPVRLHGWRAAAAMVWRVCYRLLLGFFLPVLILLRLHLDGGDQLLGREVHRVMPATAFCWPAVAAVVVTGCAVLTGYALRGGNRLGMLPSSGWPRLATPFPAR